MIWDQQTFEEIQEMDKNVPVILPIAATEQHGAHLPLATDRLIGEYFAKNLHHTIPEKVLILPSLGIGCSTHHMKFPGTLTLSHETFQNQIIETIESVLKHGFKNMR